LRAWLDSRSLVTKAVTASIVLSVLVAGAFVVLLVTLSDLQSSTNVQTSSRNATTATLQLQQVVNQLETSLRAFVVSDNDRFLASWREGRRQLPQSLDNLERLLAGRSEERQQSQQLSSLIHGYVTEYGLPLIAIARLSPEAARSPVATREGVSRITTIRGRLDRLLATEGAQATAEGASAQSESERALPIAVGALVAAGGLLVLYAIFLTRRIARPVGAVAEGASRIAAGDLSTRLPEGGAAEIDALTRAFNTMAASLEQGQHELERQNEKLRQSERLKSQLVSIVSHELRTPLSSILGYTRLMLKRDTDQRTLRKYVEIIHDQGERLAGLIEGFLAAEDRNGSGIELAPDAVDLGELIRREVELIAADSPDHDLSVTVDQKPLIVHADGERLAQVVINLVTNAVKYSPAGGAIRVEVRRHGDTIRASVQDEGLGIAAEHQSRVFSKFFRGEARASGIPGVGLGLALSREIVEAHGGRIEFTSVENRGSTFWFELPAYAQNPAVVPQKGNPV
jgi:signal transduction histidine kinase